MASLAVECTHKNHRGSDHDSWLRFHGLFSPFFIEGSGRWIAVSVRFALHGRDGGVKVRKTGQIYGQCGVWGLE